MAVPRPLEARYKTQVETVALCVCSGVCCRDTRRAHTCDRRDSKHPSHAARIAPKCALLSTSHRCPCILWEAAAAWPPGSGCLERPWAGRAASRSASAAPPSSGGEGRLIGGHPKKHSTVQSNNIHVWVWNHHIFITKK